MAKSYKKFPIVKQEKVDKKHWNRRLRRQKLDYSLKGSQYKKIFQNWDTWQYMWTKEDATNDYYRYKHIQAMYPTLEDWINYWERLCHRK